jgi:hypothetical protein
MSQLKDLLPVDVVPQALEAQFSQKQQSEFLRSAGYHPNHRHVLDEYRVQWCCYINSSDKTEAVEISNQPGGYLRIVAVR